MAINYITIDSMTPIPRPSVNDKLLVARADGNETGYSTYQCTLGALSNAISCDVSEAARKNWLITALYESAPADATSKAPSYNVLLSVYNNEKYLSSHYLNADQTGSRSIAGNITFSNYVPNVGNVEVNAANGSKVVNCNALIGYVAANVKTRSIGNDNPVSYVYRVVTKDADTDAVYESQTKNIITRLQKDCKDGPIVHKCTQDCTVIVTAYSVGYRFALFGFQDNNSASMTKAGIKSNQSTLNWHMLGRLGSYWNSGNSGIMSFQAKAGTWLCFYMNENWDSTNFKYIPNYKADFGSGDVIRIDEYRT